MLARPPADPPTGASGRTSGSVWPWAVTTVALVTLIVVATFLGRLITTNAQRAELGVAAPPYPPMRVTAIVQPGAGAALFAVDSGAGKLVALARPSDVTCPPIGLCPTPAQPNALMILDGESGAPLSTTPLTGDARAAESAGALLVDSAAHLAYAVTPTSVVIFSTQNGARVGGYDLPRDFGVGETGGAALDAAHNTLALADTQRLMLADTASGAIKATDHLPAATYIDGPVLDNAHGRLYLELRPAAEGAPTLASYDARTLQPTGQFILPAGVRLGPTDNAGHILFLFGADGSTWRLALDAVSATNAEQGPQPAPLTRDVGLTNALALGENSALAHRYALTAQSERIIASASGSTLAALPLTAPWRSTAPLPVDASRNLAYLPADHGFIIIVRDGGGGSGDKGALSSGAAIILARDALREIYNRNSSAIPLLSPTFFPLQPGHRDQGFWFLPNGGPYWLGPFPGTAATSISPASRGNTGEYQVQFSLAWTDPETGKYTHDWVWRVQSSGARELLNQY
jgi:hypothetical protein